MVILNLTVKIIETPSEVDGLNDMSISFSEEEDPSSARYSLAFISARVGGVNFLT